MITLRNPCYPDLSPVQAEALGDPVSMHTCIPQHVAIQLRLKEYDRREVTIADGSKKLVRFVGPLEIRFKNRIGFGGAVILGDQILFGAIAMADMDLVILPKDRRLDVNPLNPNIACTIAM
jgi:clan AA aspartic protease